MIELDLYIDEAHRTLSRAATYLGKGAFPRALAGAPVAGSNRARVLGNSLRELDRFLNILVGTVGHAVGTPPRVDERNTANALRRVRRSLGVVDPDHERLRALGRSRDCLFHLRGRIGRGDTRDGTTMTAGWPALRPHRFRVGDTMTITPADLAEICAFYRTIADDLVGTAACRTSGDRSRDTRSRYKRLQNG